MSFWPAGVPGGAERVQMTIRNTATGWPVPLPHPYLTDGVTDCFGGQGVYGSMEEFTKVLHSILVDDEKLLNSESTTMMFRSQLTEASLGSLQNRINTCDSGSVFIGILDNELLYDWGPGGMLTMEDEPSGRRPNTLFWSGKPNLFWISITLSALNCLDVC